MKSIRIPGILAYAAMALWFLLVIMAPQRARAAELSAAPAADFADLVKAALVEDQAADAVEFSFDSPLQAVAVEPGAPPIIEVRSYNRQSGRFVVLARANTSAEPAQLTGAARIKRRMLVLSAPLGRGEIIRESELEWIESADAPHGAAIDDVDDLVGKAARRPLRAGQPLRESDVEAPILIRKGATVTMTIVANGLRLTHLGIANGQGAQGDLIEIRNAASDRIVRAIVTGPNRAEVPFAAQIDS